MTNASQRGLTLPELLIALLIFAMISSVGVYTLRLAVDGGEQLERADDLLREWQLARLTIRQDMAQLAPRIVRDEYGRKQTGAFVGGMAFSGRTPVEGEEPLAGFVRRGWSNPENASPRSELQYVEYILKGNAIIRRTRPYLDDARNQPSNDRILFDNVYNVQLTFLSGETSRGLEWSEFWPLSSDGDFAPRAMRLTFESARLGDVEQLFWIGGFYDPSALGASSS